VPEPGSTSAHLARHPHAPPRTRIWALNLGGFLGPFGGGVVAPMLPELADRYGTPLTTVAWSMSVYTLPFALLMLVSGTLADGWGRRRTVRGGYLLYVAATLLCAVAPTIATFFGGRALQGVANAFTTPLLVAALYDAVPAAVLGRALGRFASLQAAGMAFAPLVGGAAASIDYRWAFVVVAAAAGLLACVPPRDATHAERGITAGVPQPTARERWRSLANPRLARASAMSFLFNLSAAGVLLLVALLAVDRFDLGPTVRGLVVAAFGTAGLVAAPWIGHVVDRAGARRAGLVAFALLATVTVLIGLSPSVLGVVIGVALAGAAATGSRVVVNSLALASTPSNRAGATSFAMSMMFLGTAVAPLLFLPAYTRDVALGFAVAAVGAALAAALLAPKPR